jgi:hypothetical protein
MKANILRWARRRSFGAPAFQPVIGGSTARAAVQTGGTQSCAGLPACSLSVRERCQERTPTGKALETATRPC